jgi:hypothetical protein
VNNPYTAALTGAGARPAYLSTTAFILGPVIRPKASERRGSDDRVHNQIIRLRRIYVKDVVQSNRADVLEHKTVVEVDEAGTVAAAATGIGGTEVVAPQYAITVDHPFFYAIQDDKTGELLFIGVLMNPS